MFSVISKPIFRLSVVMLVNENILKLALISCKDISQKHRNYAKWSIRKPSKVYMPEDISSGSIKSDQFYDSEYDISKTKKVFDHSNELNQKTSKSLESNKLNLSQNLDYEVLEENDLTFSQLMTHAGSRKMRRKNDIMVLEGKRLNLDALKAGLKAKKIFFTQKSILDELNIPQTTKVQLYKIPYKTIHLWSKLETPPGIVGFYRIPMKSDIVPVNSLPIKVLCDNVRDPGNLGSIIRVAASVGCTEILLMKGCTDPWDSKVLRSASGGHFHIPIKTDLVWSEQEKFLKPSDEIFLADSQPVRTQVNHPLQPYHSVNFSDSRSSVVVIGGETEGLSKEALALGGVRLYIPLSNCMESLNSGCALSVILFEIKKQLLAQMKV